MNPVLIQQIVQLLIQAVTAGIQFGPAIIADIKLVWELAASGTVLTPDQQTQADTTLAAAHQELQAKIALDAETDVAGD